MAEGAEPTFRTPPATSPDIQRAAMADLRQRIDALDEEIVALLALRQTMIEEAARIKSRVGMAARLPERVDEVLAHVVATAEKRGLSVELAHALWTKIIEWSIAREEAAMGVK